MKYLLFYFVVASATYWYSDTEMYNYIYNCNSQQGCVPYIQHDQGQWTAELKNSKTECMDALKKSLAPTKAYCIPVNGYTNDLTPY